MKPMLKAPRTKRLKLKYDEMPSNVAFKFNLRRYTLGHQGVVQQLEEAGSPPPDKKLVQAMKTMREELVLAGKEDAAAERGEGAGDRGQQVAEAEAALRRACLNAERRSPADGGLAGAYTRPLLSST